MVRRVSVRSSGISLIEVLLVVVLLAIIIPAMLLALTSSYVTVREARMLELAKHIGQLKMEQALANPAEEDEREFEGFPGFRTEVRIDNTSDLKGLEISVFVRYRFFSYEREQRMVTLFYGT